MPAKPAADAAAKTGAEKPCPICRKPGAAPFLPFCSKRCRDVDLNRWLSNTYVIPAKEEDDEDPQ